MMMMPIHSQKRSIVSMVVCSLLVLFSSTQARSGTTVSSTAASTLAERVTKRRFLHGITTTTTLTTTKTTTAPPLSTRGGGSKRVSISTANATATTKMPTWKADLFHRVKVGLYFALWYALNIVYNSKWCGIYIHRERNDSSPSSSRTAYFIFDFFSPPHDDNSHQ